MTHIIAVASEKGGVGKTTIATNLLAWLALRCGKDTIIVDLDSQGNATQSVEIDNPALVAGNGTHQLLDGTASLADVALRIDDRRRIVGSHVGLAALEPTLHDPSKTFTLKNALHGADADFIVVDCPPSLGPLTYNGLAAATHVIMPLRPDYYSISAANSITRTIEMVKKKDNPDLAVLGFVLNEMPTSPMTRLATDVKRELNKLFGSRGLFGRWIRAAVRFQEAASRRKSVFEFGPSKALNSFSSFAWEVKKRGRF